MELNYFYKLDSSHSNNSHGVLFGISLAPGSTRVPSLDNYIIPNSFPKIAPRAVS
jgi:hypothetical protein